MYNLTIDIGNSFSKVAVFKNRDIIYFDRLILLGEAELTDLLKKYPLQKSIISSVDEDIAAKEIFLNEHTDYVRFSTEISKGVTNNYKTPKTLGLDRWAAILAANGLYPNKSCFIIDAGTCITYDLITGKGIYSGGSISPGINMRFEALNYYTGRLPKISWDAQNGIPEGTDTQTAIQNGVLQGVLNEVEGFISINHKKEKNLTVILTGGDASFLEKHLKERMNIAPIINDPYLVLRGLNEVITL